MRPREFHICILGEVFCRYCADDFIYCGKSFGLRKFRKSGCGSDFADAFNDIGVLLLCHLMEQRKDN